MSDFRRAVVQATTGQYISLLIGFASILVLARLLLPEEVGVFSVGASVLAIIHVFRDFGIAQYVVREPELTDVKLGTCFSLSVVIAWIFAGFLLAAVPSIATFYEQPGLKTVLWILSAGLMLVPFNSVRMALLRRDMRFDILFFADIASASANAVVAITLALLGYGFVSLAWGALASIGATFLLVQLSSAGDRHFRPAFSEWRSVCSFGGLALSLNLVTRVGNKAPDLIIGKSSGMFEVGILSRARGLVDLLQTSFLNTISTVTYSQISRKFREGKPLGQDYLVAVSYLSVIAWPCYAFVLINAAQIIRLLFGPNWDASAALVEVLVLTGFFAPFWVFNGTFFTTIGKIGVQFRIQAVSHFFKICAWLLAIPYDLMAAIAAYVVVHCATVVVSCIVLTRTLEIRASDALRRTLLSLAVTIGAISVPVLSQIAALDQRIGANGSLILSAAALAPCWIGAVYLFRHPIRREIDIGIGKLRAAFG